LFVPVPKAEIAFLGLKFVGGKWPTMHDAYIIFVLNAFVDGLVRLDGIVCGF
jgi:hypothetical protein